MESLLDYGIRSYINEFWSAPDRLLFRLRGNAGPRFSTPHTCGGQIAGTRSTGSSQDRNEEGTAVAFDRDLHGDRVAAAQSAGAARFIEQIV